MNTLVKNMYALLKHDNPNVLDEKTIRDSAFIEMDKNGDNKITMDEFLMAVEAEAEFTMLLAGEVDKILLN